MAKKSVSKFRQKVGKSDLAERTREAYETKDDSGKFQSYIDSSIPLKQWKCDEGDHVIDIIPFLTGENNPNGLPPDVGAQKVEVYAHFGIGINENAYVCPAMTFPNENRRCPICEYRMELRKSDDYDEQEFKDLAPRKRVVYQIVCYDTEKEEAKGVQYWETSHHLAEKNIAAIAKNNRTGEFVKYADPDDGKTIEFTRKGKGITTDYEGFKFTERPEPISDEILDMGVSLDDYIVIKTFKELEKIFYGTSSSSDEEEGEYDPEDDNGYEGDPEPEADLEGYEDPEPDPEPLEEPEPVPETPKRRTRRPAPAEKEEPKRTVRVRPKPAEKEEPKKNLRRRPASSEKEEKKEAPQRSTRLQRRRRS